MLRLINHTKAISPFHKMTTLLRHSAAYSRNPAWLALMITLSFLSPNAYAFFCPTNFNQINFGDTIEEVKQKCGNPAKEETKEADEKVPQEWTYYIPQTVVMSPSMQTQGTLKVSIAFDKTGKAINISANGIGVGETTVCGLPIQLGIDQEAVKSACGKPSFINKEQPASSSSNATTPPDDTTKITEFTYTSNPPTVLIFEGGKLTEKK